MEAERAGWSCAAGARRVTYPPAVIPPSVVRRLRSPRCTPANQMREPEYNLPRVVADGRKRYKRQQAREQLKQDALKEVKSRRIQLAGSTTAGPLSSVSIEPSKMPGHSTGLLQPPKK